METIDFINNIARICFINILTYVVFIKLINYKTNSIVQTIQIIIVSVLEAIIYTISIKYLDGFIRIILLYSLHGLIIAKITNNRIQYSIIITCISLAISYVIYIISIALSGIIV